MALSVCGPFILWPFPFVRSVTVSVCGRVCGHLGLWPLRSVAVSVCGRFGLWLLCVWPFRFVAVMTCYLLCNVPARIRTWIRSTLSVASQRSIQFGQRVRPASERLAGQLGCHNCISHGTNTYFIQAHKLRQ